MTLTCPRGIVILLVTLKTQGKRATKTDVFV